MVFGRILRSNRGVMHRDGGVLGIRPAGREAGMNGKEEAGRSRFDLHQLARGNGNGDDGVRLIDMKEETM